MRSGWRMAAVLVALGSVYGAAAPARPPATGAKLLLGAQALVRSLGATSYLHEREARGAEVSTDGRGHIAVSADCSGFVSYNLQRLEDPRYYQAVERFKEADKQERHIRFPRAYLYWRYFSQLPAGAPFTPVARLMDAQPGDLVVWCLGEWCEVPRPPHVKGDTGHLLIVAAPPVQQDATHAFVLGLDASSLAHYGCDEARAALPASAAASAQDAACRSYPDVRDAELRPGGVGAGIIRFTLDARGAPSAFQFAPRYGTHPRPDEVVRFAIVRLR